MQAAIAKGLVCSALIGATSSIGIGIMPAQPTPTQNTVIALDHGWQFRQITPAAQDAENGWLPATVPGDVHLDLLANKKIPDHFFRDNEAKLQWIENESWEYLSLIHISEPTRQAEI